MKPELNDRLLNLITQAIFGLDADNVPPLAFVGRSLKATAYNFSIALLNEYLSTYGDGSLDEDSLIFFVEDLLDTIVELLEV